MNSLISIDHSAMRVNQAVIIFILIGAFVFNLPWFVGIACFAMLFGTIILHKPGFAFIYTAILKPAGLIRPENIPDHPEPHLFAQAVGGTFLLVGSAAFAFGFPALGWILSWTVTALAALNLFAGFCVGCAMYYWFNHLRLPGFKHSAPIGTFPGMRPSRKNTTAT